MTSTSDFRAVFERLKKILEPYRSSMVVVADEPGNFYLNTPYVEKFKKEVEFAVATIHKSYVSFYLMPVYVFPDLLDGISVELQKRRQGKSCFNFKTIDETLFAELEDLTRRGAERFRTLRGESKG